MNKILKKAEGGEPVSYEEAEELFLFDDSERLFETARLVARENIGKKITFYKNAFPPVSVTGTKCALSCHHCQGHYLKHMAPATTNEALLEYCTKLQNQGVAGIVLSGGSRRDGIVPLDDFEGGIRDVKDKTDLSILAHTGPINDRQANTLSGAGLDGSLLDVIGSADTTEKVLGVRITPERYASAIKAINENEMMFSPHIIVGLDYGKINGELKALELLRGASVDNICIIVLIPTKGTPMENVPPPSPETVGRITAIAKLMHPDVPISLGCVRPGKNYRQAIDKAAILAGASKVAIPSNAAEKTAKELGLKIKEIEQSCCGLRND
ncbi:hypothetical protein KKA03_05150 [archaeon]|nr:hypothetical protein [archaeon]